MTEARAQLAHRRAQLARRRALTELARRHQAEYFDLHEAELAKIPDPRLDDCAPDQAQHRAAILKATG